MSEGREKNWQNICLKSTMCQLSSCARMQCYLRILCCCLWLQYKIQVHSLCIWTYFSVTWPVGSVSEELCFIFQLSTVIPLTNLTAVILVNIEPRLCYTVSLHQPWHVLALLMAVLQASSLIVEPHTRLPFLFMMAMSSNKVRPSFCCGSESAWQELSCIPFYLPVIRIHIILNTTF